MRFIREFFRPKEKCARIGHKEVLQHRQTYRDPEPEERYYAVFRCHEERKRCARCKAPLSEWDITDREGYTGYSMPTSMADELRRNGVVEI